MIAHACEPSAPDRTSITGDAVPIRQLIYRESGAARFLNARYDTTACCGIATSLLRRAGFRDIADLIAGCEA